LDKRQVVTGQPVMLQVMIKNVATGGLSFGESTPAADNHVRITREKGDLVQATKEGRRLTNAAEIYVHPITMVICPGETHIERLGLDKLFEISAPGEYSITVTRVFPNQSINGNSKATSNTVTLTVK